MDAEYLEYNDHKYKPVINILKHMTLLIGVLPPTVMCVATHIKKKALVESLFL